MLYVLCKMYICYFLQISSFTTKIVIFITLASNRSLQEKCARNSVVAQKRETHFPVKRDRITWKRKNEVVQKLQLCAFVLHTFWMWNIFPCFLNKYYYYTHSLITNCRFYAPKCKFYYCSIKFITTTNYCYCIFIQRIIFHPLIIMAY